MHRTAIHFEKCQCARRREDKEADENKNSEIEELVSNEDKYTADKEDAKLPHCDRPEDLIFTFDELWDRDLFHEYAILYSCNGGGVSAGSGLSPMVSGVQLPAPPLLFLIGYLLPY